MTSITNEQRKQKMMRRKEVQEQLLAEKKEKKGLIIVNTGNGKGKTTAALGMVLRSKELSLLTIWQSKHFVVR